MTTAQTVYSDMHNKSAFTTWRFWKSKV